MATLLLGPALFLGAAGGCSSDGKQGPKGDPGDPGAAGQQGAAGATGAPGPAGADGATGQTGAAGPAGDAGPAGPAGDPASNLSEEARQGLAIAPVALTFDPAQAERVGRGSYIVNAAAPCGDCHTNPGPGSAHLGGGQGFPLGDPSQAGTPLIFARNLTPDPTTGLQHTEDEFITTLRTGLDRKTATSASPERLLVMPWQDHRYMSDEDLRSVYAYLKAIPPVTNTVPDDMNRPSLPPVPFAGMNFNTGLPSPDETLPDPGNVQHGFAASPIDVSEVMGTAEEQVKVGRGAYLVNSMGSCNGCHTMNPNAGPMDLPGISDVLTMAVDADHFLGGGQVFAIPGLPAVVVSANIAGLPDPISDFLGVITQGHHGADVNFRPVLPPMPWPAFRNLTLDDLESIYTYLQALPEQSYTIPGVINQGVTRDPAFHCADSSTCASGETCTAGFCAGRACSSDDDCPVTEGCGGTTCVVPQ